MAVETKVPASDGTINKDPFWFPSSGADFYALIDEGVSSHDSDTTYIENRFSGSLTWAIFRTAAAFAIAEGNTIDKVSVSGVARFTNSGPPSIGTYFGIFTGTTRRQATITTPTDSYAVGTVDWLTNPATSAAWTLEEVNATDATTAHRLVVYGSDGFGIGGRMTSYAGRLRLTALEISVTYTEGGGGGGGVISQYPYYSMLMGGAGR